MAESKQFSDPKLVAAYDSINPLGEDADFWLREIEKLAPEPIIDFGCGTGLLTCELAKLGYETTGIDLFGAMLEIAKQKQYGDKVRWIEGDYKKLVGLRADLILMTSHVAQFLITDEEWCGMLKNAYSTINDGGHIMFDSRRSLKESFVNWPTQENPRLVTDPALGEIEYWCNLLKTTDTLATYELHYTFKQSGETIVSTDTIIFRSKEAIEKSLGEAGFAIKTVYGDWDGSLFSKTSPEMLFVAQKKLEC